MFDATLTVGLPPILTENYVSRVRVDLEAMTVEAKSIRSTMFDSLKSRWKLRPILPAAQEGLDHNDSASIQSTLKDCPEGGDGAKNSEGVVIDEKQWCDVEFDLEMKVSDPVMIGALDKVLEEVAGRQVTAFEQRCFHIPDTQR